MRAWPVLFVLLAAGAVRAQEGARVEATVVQVAGANAYLDVGAAAGLTAADTLAALRGERALGRLVVVSAASDRAVVTFAAAPFSLTRGDRLTLVLPARAAPAPPEPAPVVPPVAERPSILDRPSPTTPTRVDRPTRPPSRAWTGRLQIGTDAFQSRTEIGEGAEPVGRSFATPFVALRAQLGARPGGWRADVHARAAYRYAEGLTLDRPFDARIYALSVTRETGSVQIRAGRFTPEYDPYGGGWDGVTAHAGTRTRGVAVALGLEPDRGVGPSAGFPKAAVFAHTTATRGDLRWDGTALAGVIRPGGGRAGRTFVGLRQQARARRLSLTADVLADREPDGGAWTFSRLGARASAEAAPGVRLHAQAIRRRPYLLFGATQLLLPASTRVTGGASLTGRRGALAGATLRAEASTAWAEGFPATRSLGGGLSLPRLPGLGVGLSADGSAWTRTEVGAGLRGVTGGAALTRAFGAGLAQVGYRTTSTPLLGGAALTTHGLDALLQLPLSERLALTAQATRYAGSGLASTRLYAALWWRL